MGPGRYCLNCGFVFYGQRTGKCPSCDQSAFTKSEEFYPISPADIRRFEEFDRKGGDIMVPGAASKNVSLLQTSPERKWVSLSVLGAVVTFADHGQGPKIIYSQTNNDGFGVDDFPEKVLIEATQIAANAMKG
ncbi:hypothetical protein KJ866_04100 [Patescibacteria group bacterium]|nr:hypothetical protein [Patescibacteria group bacterium]